MIRRAAAAVQRPARRASGYHATTARAARSAAMPSGKNSAVTEDYARGRRDGLRLALAVLAAEEAKWAALLGESRSWRTNATREVRHKALQVAQTRVRTVLNRMSPKAESPALDAELEDALEAIGL
ncbi:hypothetical protein GCM10011380_32070 [Sphingomonas metalli]|uniref:Uncharacterized protein n=1 Tax=Sphingomonas metalli TaxID=1779358 RepID=A0A916WWV0_9SPHN|nr:hypothetical protein [Sphingomonas metalli]GGB40205.1 hypothetical protein GCM10011380_32070 [Sphingomonas metalli]